MSLRRGELNTLKVLKGTRDGKRFPIWDSVRECDESCSLISECEFDKKAKNGEVVRCKLQVTFLRTMMDITLDSLPDAHKTEYYLQKVGLTLLPLYKQLIVMQMEEQALMNPIVGLDGSTKIHPVYKEIRIITKDIDKCLVSLGVHLDPLLIGKGIGTEGTSSTGDSSYYEDMMEEHEEEGKKHNKKKKSKKEI